MGLGQFRGVGQGTLIFTDMNDSTDPATGYTDSDVVTMLTDRLNNTNMPPPIGGTYRFYAVILPVGIKNSLTQFAGQLPLGQVDSRGAASASADKVRVFFRLFVAQSCDTDFQPSTTYKSTLGTTGADLNHPVFPLPSGTGLVDPSGQSVQTIPFFERRAAGTHDYDGSVANGNVRTMQIPSGSDAVWAYFGCFLDVYDASNNAKFAGTHHCIVAEIAYDDAPIVNANGIVMTPASSDKLAQRNLQLTFSDNPGTAETHRVPQTFDLKPAPRSSRSQASCSTTPTS